MTSQKYIPDSKWALKEHIKRREHEISFKSCPAQHLVQFVIYCTHTLKHFGSTAVRACENSSSGEFCMLTRCYCSLFMKLSMQWRTGERWSDALARGFWIPQEINCLTLTIISDTPANTPIIYEMEWETERPGKTRMYCLRGKFQHVWITISISINHFLLYNLNNKHFVV